MKYHYQAGVIVPFAQKHYKQLILAVAAIFMASMAVATLNVKAETVDVDFETYALGDINGQDGWTKTGPFDSEVDTNTSGFGSLGAQSLRISNAVTSGSFGDQTFAKPLADAVGEADSTSGSFSTGTLQNHFEAEFDLASVMPATPQPGLFVSVSPDRGDGSRMSYLGFADTVAGIEVTFYDVQGEGDPANFVATSLGTFDRSSPHTFKLTMDMVDGASNDVVNVYIDGSLVHTGTSWENYYRFDSEASAEQSPRIVKTLLFRVSGAAVPANSGNGFLFDNVSLTNEIAEPPVETEVDVYGNTAAGENQVGWMFNRDTNTDTPFEFNDEEASLGEGSIEILPIGTNAADKFIAEYFYLDEVANVASISYDFQTANAADADQFYMNLYVNDGLNPAEFYDCRYSVVPTTTDPDPVTGFTTFTYDLSTPTSVATSGTASIACPAAPADLADGAILRAIAINVGDTGAADAGLTGYLDNVVLTLTNGDSTVFDFEPNVSGKEDCKDGGWVRGLSDGRQFKNQGDCVSYFATKQKNPPAGGTTSEAANARRR